MTQHAHVRDFMTKGPVTLREDDLLRQAVEIVMVRRIRHIPVLDQGGRLVGIVTDRDVQGTLPSPLSAAAPEEYEALLETTPRADHDDGRRHGRSRRPRGEAVRLSWPTRSTACPSSRTNASSGSSPCATRFGPTSSSSGTARCAERYSFGTGGGPSGTEAL